MPTDAEKDEHLIDPSLLDIWLMRMAEYRQAEIQRFVEAEGEEKTALLLQEVLEECIDAGAAYLCRRLNGTGETEMGHVVAHEMEREMEREMRDQFRRTTGIEMRPTFPARLKKHREKHTP